MLASGVRELAPLKVADRGRHDLASVDLAQSVILDPRDRLSQPQNAS
jgi:hypothetical protein